MWKEASVATVEREEKLSAAASALEQNLTLGAKISICVYVCTYVCMYVSRIHTYASLLNVMNL